MRWFKGMAAVLAAVAVAACGGGGKGGTVTDPDAPVAADLALTLGAPSVENSGSKTVSVSVVAVDDKRVALPDVAVQMSVDNNAVIQMDAGATDDSGEVEGEVRIGSDRSNRVITVTATSGGITRTATFQVTGARLQATLEPAIVAPDDDAQVTYRLLDVNSNAMAGQAITVSAPGLTTREGVTDANGAFVFRYTAPSTTGNLRISANAGGDDDRQTVIVQDSSGSIPNVTAGSVRSASISANPSVVPINTESTSNESSIRALFVGTKNKPIKDVRVRFDLNGNANSIPGEISSGDAIVYSDANGQAIASYIPGSRFSPTDGVEVRACWDYADFAEGTCPNEVVTTLTVVAEALGVTIGANNLLEEGVDELTYIKKFIVQVVDSSGVAKSGVLITPSIDLTNYAKGAYDYGTDLSDPLNPRTGWLQGVTAVCFNEDGNRNGIIEASEKDGQVNLVNGDNILDNGNNVLEPRKGDVTVSVVGSNRTDAKGQVVLQIEYPKSHATWVRYNVLVAASGVGGTEGRDNFEAWLSALADDASDQEVDPPFVVSPYGTAGSCGDPD